MILYIENPTDTTRKLLDLINEYNKVAGYKIYTQKIRAFLYTNNEKTEIQKNLKNSGERNQSESEVTQLYPTVCDSWTVAHQASPSMGFSR